MYKIFSLPAQYSSPKNLQKIKSVLIQNKLNGLEIEAVIIELFNGSSSLFRLNYNLDTVKYRMVLDLAWVKLMKQPQSPGTFEIEKLSNNILSQVKDLDSMKQTTF